MCVVHLGARNHLPDFSQAEPEGLEEADGVDALHRLPVVFPVAIVKAPRRADELLLLVDPKRPAGYAGLPDKFAGAQLATRRKARLRWPPVEPAP